MIVPPYLQKGDRIAIVATARSIAEGQIDNMVSFLKQDGFEPVIGTHIYDVHDRYAGNDSRRAEDLQLMLDDPKIKAVICARGGYGTARMIDDIDWSTFVRCPKWICGFSDATVLHSHVNSIGVASIHSTMATGLINTDFDDPNYRTLVSELIGKPKELKVEHNDLNRPGETEAELIGGNLAVFSSIMGSPSDTRWDGKILMLEDVCEYPYNVDRMMLNLRRAGRLKGLAGLVVGDISEQEEDDIPFGKTMYEVVAEHVKSYDFPVAFGFPIGHEKRNLAIRLGGKVHFCVSSKRSMICY